MTTETLYKWFPITEDLELNPKCKYLVRGEIFLPKYLSVKKIKENLEKHIYCERQILISVQAISLEEHEKEMEEAKKRGYERAISELTFWE